jgi:hypothetical protein
VSTLKIAMVIKEKRRSSKAGTYMHHDGPENI